MLDTICAVLRFAYQKEWISTRDGNASYRHSNDEYMFVSPSGVRKQHLDPLMFVRYDIVDGEFVQLQDLHKKATGEISLHSRLQLYHSKDRVVLHLHPTYIIAAMRAGIDLQSMSADFPELNRYTKVGPTVPAIPPISEELCNAVCDAFELDSDGNVSYDIIGLESHGVVIIADTARNAIEHCERLEHICRIVLASNVY